MRRTAGPASQRIAVIARREYLATVRRREFLLVTLGLPFLYLLILVIVGISTASAVGSSARHRRARAPLPAVIGIMDRSHTVNFTALQKAGEDSVTGRVFTRVSDGQRAVRSGLIRAFLVLPADFRQTGRVTLYGPTEAPTADVFGEGGSSAPFPYTRTLRRAILYGHIDESIIAPAIRPLDVTSLKWDARTGRFSAPDPLRFLAKFAVPYVFSLLLMMCVLVSSSYLLHGIVEEKENRVIEVLLSAVTPDELLAGKMLGLGGAGLTQFVIWVGGGLLVGAGARSLLPFPVASFAVSPGLIVTALGMFLLGFGLYAALMAGIGSLGTSWRESQQIGGVAATLLVLPLLFLAAILEEPDGLAARLLSLFPLTAPVGMVLRVAAGGGSVAEVILACVLLAATAWAVIRLAARIFRVSLLLYGQRPGPVEILRALRAAGRAA